jgi:starch phosphorylase
MEKYFTSYFPILGLSRDTFLSLGIHPENPGDGFNMTALALRLSSYHNAVSRRHGEVSRHLWRSLWPDLPEDKVPIRYITNGVHVPTWIEPRMERLFDTYLGADWIARHDEPDFMELVENIPEKDVWQTHFWLKMKLINSIRERARRSWVNKDASPAVILAEGTLLNPTVLTIGFSRRFTAYKRADLIFTDFARISRLINDPWKPIQIIFAGKAHPEDDEGKRILQRVFNFANRPDLGGRVAFVENYDEQLAQYMVHGVDVWLNNPLPPLEACGTSGMKASLNGVPHLSIRDGWWLEGYNGRNGWEFGDGDEQDRDRKDANEIYSLLEREIIPLYYAVDDKGSPRGWVKLMKEAMKSTTAQFSTRRMAKEYVRSFYRTALESRR